MLSKEPLRLCTYRDHKNDLDKSFSHILEYLQLSSLPNIPNCDTTYQLPCFKFINLYLWIQVCIAFCIRPCLIARASTTSSCSYTVGLSCITAHNIGPPWYTTQGYSSINNVTILFHISILKPQHNQWLAVSTRFIQKRHILYAFNPFHRPLIGIGLWTNHHRKQTIFLLIVILQ